VSAQDSAAPAAAPSRWQLDRGDLAAWAVGAVLMALAFGTMALSGSTVSSLVKEDGLVEWIGAIGLFAGAAFFLAAFFVARRRGAASGKSTLGTWVLLLSAIVLFGFGGEEISWGQRLFGWGTPASLSEVNAQGETTFHNLRTFQGTTLDGDRLFRVGWFAVFVLLPLAAWLVPRWRRRLNELLPVVPIWVAALFVTAFVFTHVAKSVFDHDWTSIYAIGSAATEIQEACVEAMMGVAAFTVLQGVRGRGRGGDRSSS
jgi:hypothetical protein